MNLVLYFDGSCEPNPGGRMGYGWVIEDEFGRRKARGRGVFRHKTPTNNVAELGAMLAGLRAVYKRFCGEVKLLTVRGDSQLAVNVVSGRWRAKKPHLKLLKADCQRQVALVRAESVVFEWIPRRLNSEADALACGGLVH